MNLGGIKQQVGAFERTMQENPLAVWGLIIAGLLAFLLLGGLLLDTILEKRKLRQKAQAFERLQKHLASLPGSKS
jgi:p-aminobenzoyl-glutamate transporter AbgT